MNKSGVNPIVKKSWAFNGSMSTAALLLPLMVAGESRIQTEAAGTAAVATAHVNFKIIIPKVLYLRIGGEGDRIADTETVAIMSNSRNVTLNATVRTPESGAHARGSVVVLSASARKVLAQDALCTAGDAHATPAPAEAGRMKVDDRQVVCTVSMP
jgi:hypothetical protein